MTHLWFTEFQIDAIRKRLTEGHPHVVGLRDFAAGYADQPLDAVKRDQPDKHGQHVIENDTAYLTGCGVMYLLTGEREYADKAFEGQRFILEGWTNSDLNLAGKAMRTSQLLACCGTAWDAEQKQTMHRQLARMVRTFPTPREGNPHMVGNNWWAVTHSGALIAALTCHNQPTGEGDQRYDMTEPIAWSRGRLRAFCKHFGDRGLYHEGLGYQMYTCSLLLPAMLASRNFDGVDFLDHFPAMRQIGPSLFAATCNRQAFTDNPDEQGPWGAKLSWNDDGQAFGAVACVPVMMHFAPEAQQGALRTLYDQLQGCRSPEPRYSVDHNGLLPALTCYPYDIEPTDPNDVLPTGLCDSRQGLAIYRDRYRDGDDAVLGCYARTTHIGGHKQQDAGSIRFMALGHDWILGGGQARAEARWQSVVTPADGPHPDSQQRGTIIWDQPASPDGSRGPVWAVDLRPCTVGYHERYVAARWSEDAPALALLDQIDDHLGRAFDWHLTFAPHLHCAIDDDQRGFTLTAPDGVTMRVAFLGGNLPEAIALEHMPDSSRSFSSGPTVKYMGRPYIRARFGPAEALGIYAVMAAKRDGAARIESADPANPTLDVMIDGQPWPRPFTEAIPADFQPRQSHGLCRNASGHMPDC